MKTTQPKPTIGQRILLGTAYPRPDRPEELRPATVKKVGRKYFSVLPDAQPGFPRSIEHEHLYFLDLCLEDWGPRENYSRGYSDADHHAQYIQGIRDEEEMQRLKQTLRDRIYHDFTLDQLRRIIAITEEGKHPTTASPTPI